MENNDSLSWGYLETLHKNKANR